MAGQRLLTGLADAGAVLLQARQHDLVAVIHLGPAKPRDVAGAGVMAACCAEAADAIKTKERTKRNLVILFAFTQQ